MTFGTMRFVRALPIVLACAGLTVLAASPNAQEPESKPSFDSWLALARSEALARGISEATVSAALPVPGWCFLNLLTFRKP